MFEEVSIGNIYDPRSREIFLVRIIDQNLRRKNPDGSHYIMLTSSDFGCHYANIIHLCDVNTDQKILDLLENVIEYYEDLSQYKKRNFAEPSEVIPAKFVLCWSR